MSILTPANNSHSDDLKVYLKTGSLSENIALPETVKKGDWVSHAYSYRKALENINGRTLSPLGKALTIFNYKFNEFFCCLQIARQEESEKLIYYATRRALKLFDKALEGLNMPAIQKECKEDPNFISRVIKKVSGKKLEDPLTLKYINYFSISEKFKDIFEKLPDTKKAVVRKFFADWKRVEFDYMLADRLCYKLAGLSRCERKFACLSETWKERKILSDFDNEKDEKSFAKGLGEPLYLGHKAAVLRIQELRANLEGTNGQHK